MQITSYITAKELVHLSLTKQQNKTKHPKQKPQIVIETCLILNIGSHFSLTGQIIFTLPKYFTQVWLQTYICVWHIFTLKQCVDLLSSDRVNHAHMVYQEVWSNAAVGQQERKAGWEQNRRARTAGRTVSPTPAPGLLIQTPPKLLLKDQPTGFWSHAGDGSWHPCVNFFPHFYERAERGATACFYFVKLRGRNAGCSWSDNLFFFLAPGEFANLSDCFIPAQRLWGTFFSQSSSEAQNAVNAAVTSTQVFGSQRLRKSHFKGETFNLSLV